MPSERGGTRGNQASTEGSENHLVTTTVDFGQNGHVRVEDYQGIAPDDQLEEISRLSGALRGLRIAHVNSTAEGGGVAEILRSLVPFMRNVGLDANWLVMRGDEPFFNITKQMHNQLQGAGGEMPDHLWDAYVGHVRRVTEEVARSNTEADVWIMHDPQTLPMASFLPSSETCVWVCHIDTTHPNPYLAARVTPWLAPYTRVLFSMDDYVFPEVAGPGSRVIPPAIDPLQPKNRTPHFGLISHTLERIGIDRHRPLIAQVSRFDRWKDPIGVIDSYRLAKSQVPDLQLALLGVITARDDPEAFEVRDEVSAYAGDDPDIHMYDDPAQVGDLEVASVQAGADVVLQKSLREGFGLSVTEALWKGRPTIGGRCGGIRLQILDGQTGFLVNNPEECAARILEFLGDRDRAHVIGSAGKERVRREFLLPRLLRDYLSVVSQALEDAPGRSARSPEPDVAEAAT